MISSPSFPSPTRFQSSFRGTRVRICEYRWSSLGSGESPSFEAAAPAVLAVSGGTATVVRGQRARWLLDPAQAIALRTGDAVQLHGGAQNRSASTVYLIATPHRPEYPVVADAPPGRIMADVVDDAYPYLPLSPSALFSFHRLQRLLEQRPRSDTACIEAHAMEFVAKAYTVGELCSREVRSAGRAGQRSARRQIAARARALMAAEPAAPHRLADLAYTLQTSPYHLAHVFREEVGVPPHRYLTRLRLIAALHRLGAGVPDLSQVALELGFSSHSHFTVTFRRVFGIPPREARALLTRIAPAPPDGASSVQCSPTTAFSHPRADAATPWSTPGEPAARALSTL